MATSRDDFSIAIRSAFLKKGVQQKFSLLALIIASIILLSLEAINSKSLNFVRSAIKDVIYRASFIASIPGNTVSPLFITAQSHFKIYEENIKLLDDKAKLVKPKWYEGKWLYFTYGAGLSFGITTLVYTVIK